MKRNFRASKGTSIIPSGNNLVIGGLDVASLAAAAVKLSGFAPTFSNSYVMDQLGTRTAHASKFYSGSMGGDGSVKTHIETINMDQLIDFCEVDIYRMFECNNSSSSSSSKCRSKEEQNGATEIGVLPKTVSETLRSTTDDVLKQYDRLLYLETSHGVLVHFPDLIRKEAHSNSHSNQSMNSSKRRNENTPEEERRTENVLEGKHDRSNKKSWRTRGNGEGKEEEKEKKGGGEERRGIGKGKGSMEGSGNDNSGHNSNDDVGNWRDNESESEDDDEVSDGDSEEESDEEGNENDEDNEGGEDTDTPNFRNSISPTITHSKTGSSSIADRHITKQDNKNNNNKMKKRSSSERRRPCAVRPVQGSVWKLLAPSSDDVAVGEI